MNEPDKILEWLSQPLNSIQIDQIEKLTKIGFEVEKEVERGLFIAHNTKYKIIVIGSLDNLVYEALKSALAIISYQNKKLNKNE